MKSSPKTGRVLLPTFEEMMCMAPAPLSQAGEPGAERGTGEDPAGREAPKNKPARPPKRGLSPEDKLAQAESLCEDMRRKASEEARQILEKARQEAEAAVRQAREQEKTRARAELDREMGRMRTSVLGAAEALQRAKDELYAALEPYFLDIAILMAETILKCELERNDQAYLSIVRSVLDQSFTGRETALHLPPARFDELAGKAGDSPFLAEMARREVEVRQNPELDEWDCLVTSDMGSIRGGVATQLSRIRSAAGGRQSEGH